MPLIILGIIAVGGGLFLVLSHLKPAIGRRLRGGYHGFGFGGFDGFGALQDGDLQKGFHPQEEPVPPAQEGGGSFDFSDEDDGKVLFIFGNGEQEERSPDKDDG